MGMDVYGRKPKNEQGEYFRANVWYWHPLWTCLDDLHPTICAKCESPHDNSGDGLNARDSLTLSKLLKKDLEKGIIEEYISQYYAHINSLPLEDCKYCEGTGNRDWDQDDGTVTTQQCNSCNGTLKVTSHIAWYHMDLELMKEFQIFLENCGGFNIH
jgi:NAD-dependent SIR2 family protein deacetylase